MPTVSTRSLRLALALGAVLLVGAVLRTHQLGAESLWLDEAYSVVTSRESLPAIVGETARDVHPPLYYFSLHAWMLAAGESEAGARALSVIFSLATVLVAFRLAARLFDPVTAIVTAALLAVLPFQIEFAQEARMYALLALLSTLSMTSFVSLAERAHARTLAGYVVWTTLALYTHVYALFLVAVQACAVGLTWWRDRDAGRVWIVRWLAGAAAVAILFLPWAFVIVHQVQRGQNGSWIPRPASFELVWTLLAFSGSVPLLVVLVPVVLFGMSRVYRDRRRDGPVDAFALSCLWMTVPVFVPFALSQFSLPIFAPKYAIASSLPFAMFAARGVAALSREWRWAAVGVIAMATIASPVSHFAVVHKDGWRSVVGQIEAAAGPDDVVLLYPAFNEIPFEYYSRSDLRLKPVDLDGTTPVGEAMRQAIGDARRVWLVIRKNDAVAADLARAVGAALTEKFRSDVPGLEAYLFVK
jgi:4-amino-4-deoxy-L-arabinose transferase-like glycosyltransferase